MRIDHFFLPETFRQLLNYKNVKNFDKKKAKNYHRKYRALYTKFLVIFNKN